MASRYMALVGLIIKFKKLLWVRMNKYAFNFDKNERDKKIMALKHKIQYKDFLKIWRKPKNWPFHWVFFY